VNADWGVRHLKRTNHHVGIGILLCAELEGVILVLLDSSGERGRFIDAVLVDALGDFFVREELGGEMHFASGYRGLTDKGLLWRDEGWWAREDRVTENGDPAALRMQKRR
jgi:hypothetical protein